MEVTCSGCKGSCEGYAVDGVTVVLCPRCDRLRCPIKDCNIPIMDPKTSNCPRCGAPTALVSRGKLT